MTAATLGVPIKLRKLTREFGLGLRSLDECRLGVLELALTLLTNLSGGGGKGVIGRIVAYRRGPLCLCVE